MISEIKLEIQEFPEQIPLWLHIYMRVSGNLFVKCDSVNWFHRLECFECQTRILGASLFPRMSWSPSCAKLSKKDMFSSMFLWLLKGTKTFRLSNAIFKMANVNLRHFEYQKLYCPGLMVLGKQVQNTYRTTQSEVYSHTQPVILNVNMLHSEF